MYVGMFENTCVSVCVLMRPFQFYLLLFQRYALTLHLLFLKVHILVIRIFMPLTLNFFFSSLCSELLLPLSVPQAHACAVFPGTDSCSCSVHLLCIDISAVITYFTKAMGREHLPGPGVARCSLLPTLA